MIQNITIPNLGRNKHYSWLKTTESCRKSISLLYRFGYVLQLTTIPYIFTTHKKAFLILHTGIDTTPGTYSMQTDTEPIQTK